MFRWKCLGGCLTESSADLENSNDVLNFCENSDEEVVEIDDFKCSNEKVNKFAEFLLIPHGQDLVDLLFHSIRFAVRFLKSKKPIGVMITKLRKHSALTSVISCVMRNIFCSLILTIKNVRNSALGLTKYYQNTERTEEEIL